MANVDCQNRYDYDILKTNLESTLNHLENDTNLFIDLLCSMRNAIKAAEGGHSKF